MLNSLEQERRERQRDFLAHYSLMQSHRGYFLNVLEAAFAAGRFIGYTSRRNPASPRVKSPAESLYLTAGGGLNYTTIYAFSTASLEREKF